MSTNQLDEYFCVSFQLDHVSPWLINWYISTLSVGTDISRYRISGCYHVYINAILRVHIFGGTRYGFMRRRLSCFNQITVCQKHSLRIRCRTDLILECPFRFPRFPVPLFTFSSYLATTHSVKICKLAVSIPTPTLEMRPHPNWLYYRLTEQKCEWISIQDRI